MKDEYGEIVELVVPIYKDKLSLFDYDASSFELVRCEDCVKCETKMVEKGNRVGNPKEKAWYCYGSLHGQRVKPDWFCADGKRRTD